MSNLRMPMPTYRAPAHMRTRFPDGYEILAEMTEMWWQAKQKAMSLAGVQPYELNAGYLSDLAKMQGKRQAWEEAIAIYAGWNGAELAEYLSQVLSDKQKVTT